MILKPKGATVDIRAGANLVGNAVLVSVVNTNTVPALIANSNGNDIWIAAGERVVIQKEFDETLIATAPAAGVPTEVFATPVAYLA